jgi:hypothetical protein
MAEKVIGLRLQINGVPQTISNIKQLEEEISKLEGKLKTTEIGSAEFSNLSNEIRTARGQLEDFNKSTEGFGFEKLVESVGKFAAGVTGGFAAATAAVQLFGGDTEEVNKAAQKAQNLLTIAIGATTIAEGVLAAKKLFSTKATVAKTAATVVTTTATVGQTAATVALTGAEVGAAAATGVLTTAIKVLGTAIKSNPIGLIIGLLASAAAAMYIFSDDTDDATAAVERLDAALKKNLQTIDDTARKTQDDLKIKLAAAEAEGATIEELSDLRQQSYQEEINAQEERLRAINNAYNKEKTILEKGLSEKEKLEEGHQKKLRELDEKYGSQKQSAIVASNNAEVSAEIDKINTLKEIRDRNIRLNEKVRDLEISLIQNDLVQQLEKRKEQYEREFKAEENNNKSRIKLTENYIKDYAEILVNAEKENIEFQIKVTKELQELQLNAYSIQLRDLQINNSEQIRLFIENSQRLNEATNVKIKDKTKILIFGQEQELNLTEKQYETLLKLQEIYQIQEQNLIKKNELEALKSLQDVQNKEILIRAKNGDDIIVSQQELLKTQLDVYNKEFEAFKKSELDKLQLLAELEAQAQKFEEQYSDPEEVKQKTKEFIKQRIEGYEKLFKVIKETGEKEVELNTKILIQQTQIQKLSEDSTLIRLDAEKVYYEELLKLYNENALNQDMSRKQILDSEDKLQQELLNKEREFKKQQLLIEKKALEDKLKLLEKDPTLSPDKIKEVKTAIAKINFDFAALERKGVDDAAAAAAKKREEQVKEILQGLEIFTQVLSKVGDLAAQNFSLQLEKSENRYNQTLERIGEDAKRVDGETQEDFLKRQELINEKRIEAEKIYNAEKKAIEKRARLTSLKIQLASSLADVASSIIKSYAQYGFTPAGIAAALLAATFGGIQIGIIGNTIKEVNSMARGGFLRGPSHEQGGIKYQGGGVEVEGNESVINRRSTLAYAPLLSQINMQGGGRPIYVNNVMDSRMAEVLASVKNEPIRAYVLEQDITKSQAVNRRLEELASY